MLLSRNRLDTSVKLLLHVPQSKGKVVMESMDADCYVIEYMMRERLINARVRARGAARLAHAVDSQGPDAVKTRFTDPGRGLVNGVRELVAEIAHTLPGWARVAKHS